MISAFTSFPAESRCKQVVFVTLGGTSLLLEIVGQMLALSADSDTLIRVILTSSFDSGGNSVVSEVVSVITDTAAVTEDGWASVSSESSISISTTFEVKHLC